MADRTRATEPSPLDGLSDGFKIAAMALAGLSLWWIHRESTAAGGVEHSMLAWAGIGLAWFCAVAGLMLALACVLAPARLIAARRERMACREAVAFAITGIAVAAFMTREVAAWPRVAGAALLLLALGVVRCMRARVPVPKPAPAPMHPLPAAQVAAPAEAGGRWDVFLSYRVTPDANAVRRLAESLVRHGYRPWFAEFEISPHEWEDSAAIARKLADGVAGSRRFLVFTNDAWTESAWCNEEMHAILQRADDLRASGAIAALADVVAEIRLPPSPAPHVVFPPLAAVRQFAVTKDTLEAWDFLERDLGWFTRRQDDGPLTETDRLIPESPHTAIAGGLAFAAAGLEQREDIFDPGFAAPGWEFASFWGEWLGREVKLRVLVNPFRSKLNVMAGMVGVSDDRALHRRFVSAFSGQLKADESITPLGTHLVHLADGHSGLAVSMLRSAGPGERALTRVFDIPLQQPARCRRCGAPLWFWKPDAERAVSVGDVIAACENPECRHAESWPRWEQATVGEVEFSFVMRPADPGLDACRAQLASLAPLMEAVACSLRPRWSARLLEWQAVVVRALALVAALEGYRYCRISLAPAWSQALWITLAGFAAAELLFAATLPGERRVMLLALYGRKMKLPLGTWFPRWWNVAKGAALQTLLTALSGLWPVGLAAAAGVYFLPAESLAMAGVLGAAAAVYGMANRAAAEPDDSPQSREAA